MRFAYASSVAIVVHVLTLAAPAAAQEKPPLVEQYLTSGRLADGEKAMLEHLKKSPDDGQARFGLGALQFLRGVERLMQQLYTYGLRSGDNELTEDLPFARLPTPRNPNPKTVTYDALQQIASTWAKDLATAEATLAQVKSSDVKLPLRFGLVRMDFNADGNAAEDETLWRVFARVQGMRDPDGDDDDDDAPATAQAGGAADQSLATKAKQFTVVLDAGDVQWLRGYCHLLMAMSDLMLGYDAKELFDATGHLFFEKVQSPYPYLQEGRKVADFGMGFDIADAIAFIHLIHFPVRDAKRVASARDHLHEMLGRSRESWKLILAETDDDREWIPNAKQQTVIPNVRVTDEMIQSWLRFLDEGESLLDGKRLAPFWRGADQRGVNLKRAFTEPTTFDLVLWVQGSAAAPYLEDGPLTRREVWRDMQRAFGGNLFGFAAWFN